MHSEVKSRTCFNIDGMESFAILAIQNSELKKTENKKECFCIQFWSQDLQCLIVPKQSRSSFKVGKFKVRSFLQVSLLRYFEQRESVKSREKKHLSSCT